MKFINKKNQDNITTVYMLRFPLFKIIKNIHAHIYGGGNMFLILLRFLILNFIQQEKL
ncbi:hypothetical protein AB6S62_000088 [Campylobacter jejuni]